MKNISFVMVSVYTFVTLFSLLTIYVVMDQNKELKTLQNGSFWNNFDKWRECVRSAETDIECEACDRLYNQSLNFNLNQ